jgi:hypothetical protein
MVSGLKILPKSNVGERAWSRLLHGWWARGPKQINALLTQPSRARTGRG